MNNPLDPTLRLLSSCGCCTGTEASTPVAIENRPGLTAVAFRSGTHAQFKASLLAALTSMNKPALADLTTRADDDFTIALLDAFSIVSDVLTFYTERIANESFLCTATERRSVLELARAIGYELRPGVAASTWLAFTAEDAPGAPDTVEIDKGTKVQSVPGPNEKPQAFETLEQIEARKEWNELKPLSREFITPYFGQTKIFLQGISTNLKPGDSLLIVGDKRIEDVRNENWDFRRVTAITTVPDPDPAKAYTIVSLHEPLGKTIIFRDSSGKAQIRRVGPAKEGAKVYALRVRANLFGHGAPEWLALGKDVRAAFLKPDQESGQPSESDWVNFTIADVTGHDPAGKEAAVALDAVYPSIAVGSWIVLSTGRAGYQEAYQVTSVTERAPHKFTLTHKVTQLGIEEGRVPENLQEKFNERLRDTSVFGQSELLPWAEAPIRRAVQGTLIELDRAVPDLPVNRDLIVQGRRARALVGAENVTLTLADKTTKELKKGSEVVVLLGPPDWKQSRLAQRWKLRLPDGTDGVAIAAPKDFEILPAQKSDPLLVEHVMLKSMTTPVDGRTTLELTTALQNAYDPASLSLFANVALSTHGETIEEVVGSGDASQAYQHFSLKQSPITYVPASTATGSKSSLEVQVAGVKWKEVGSLYGQGKRDRVFAARRADDGTTVVTFGDGKSGSRLPTGQENVSAVYRKGIGMSGLVKAGQLSLLMTRLLGLKSVTNPIASSGAQDPENIDDAKRNAPMQVLTMGRIVSLQDYEDFARTFNGIAKAHAVWTWATGGRGVFVTVIAPEGTELPENGQTITDLRRALRDYGNPIIPVQVKRGSVKKFSLSGTVTISSDYLPEKIKPVVDNALKDRFGFAASDFGKSILLSEVYAIIHGITGITSCDIKLNQSTRSVIAKCPNNGTKANEAIAAEMLVLDESSLSNLIVKVQ